MRTYRIAIALAAVLAVLAAAFWFLTGGMPGREPAPWLTAQPIAHRGRWAPGSLRPENSLAAFADAAGSGYAVELDAQLSSDGQVVVFHDQELARMTGRSGRLAEMSVEQLRQIPLLEGTQTIPTLAEALATVGGRVPVFVEIKNEGQVGALEDAVAREVSAYEGRVALISFNPYSLARVAEAAPAVPRGQLSGSFAGEDLAPHEVFLLRNLMMDWTSRPDFIAYELTELPNAATALQKMRGRPLLGWTAESVEQRKDAEAYCDAVICDPGALP